VASTRSPPQFPQNREMQYQGFERLRDCILERYPSHLLSLYVRVEAFGINKYLSVSASGDCFTIYPLSSPGSGLSGVLSSRGNLHDHQNSTRYAKGVLALCTSCSILRMLKAFLVLFAMPVLWQREHFKATPIGDVMFAIYMIFLASSFPFEGNMKPITFILLTMDYQPHEFRHSQYPWPP
jgi:hypothetical protein